MYKYALTIKYLHKGCNNIKFLMDCIDKLQLKHPFGIIYTSYELDSKNIIHTHSLIETPYRIFIRRFHIPGYSICLRPIQYEQGWHDYCYKLIQELDKQHQAILEEIEGLREKQTGSDDAELLRTQDL